MVVTGCHGLEEVQHDISSTGMGIIMLKAAPIAMSRYEMLNFWFWQNNVVSDL